MQSMMKIIIFFEENSLSFSQFFKEERKRKKKKEKRKIKERISYTHTHTITILTSLSPSHF
jgi:hypothetical protein